MVAQRVRIEVTDTVNPPSAVNTSNIEYSVLYVTATGPSMNKFTPKVPSGTSGPLLAGMSGIFSSISFSLPPIPQLAR